MDGRQETETRLSGENNIATTPPGWYTDISGPRIMP